MTEKKLNIASIIIVILNLLVVNVNIFLYKKWKIIMYNN